MKEDTRIVVDDTTIYEVDLNCYHCLSEQEKKKFFPVTVRERENQHNAGEKPKERR